MATVPVDRRLLYALAGVAGLSLLGVAFLLGRASGGPAPAATPSAAAAPSAPAGSGAAVPPPPAGPSGSAPAFAFGESPSSPAVPAATLVPDRPLHTLPIPAPGTATSPPPDDPERAAIAAYFDEVDAIQASGVPGSPESAANEMAAALARGDASGLDGLVRETEEARRRLLAIAPPAACAAHHRETVASLDGALAMLRSLREATDSADPAAALADVAARATALKTRADALKAEEEALRRRGGRAR